MILRKGQSTVKVATPDQEARLGARTSARLSEDGGLTQFGAYLEALDPGARSSERHWHEEEDELLYVVAGEATVVDDDGEHVLHAGDCACWPAGVANAHHVVNRSGARCAYLIVGTRVPREVCHYPDSGRTLHTDADGWRLVDTEGRVVKSGRT